MECSANLWGKSLLMKAPDMPQQRPEEVWAGTRISLDVTMKDGTAVEADIWIEVSTGEMRLMEVRPDGSDLDSFAQSLWNAVSNPVEGDPYRPGHIVVDRPDLAKALASMTRFQKIEVDVDPALAEQFDQLREDLEAQFRGDVGFTYLGHDDVEPEAVERFFQATASFFSHRPWEVVEQSPWLEVEGLSPAPVYVNAVGDESSPGLLLCWDLETAQNMSRGHLGIAMATDCLSLSLSEPDGIGDELKEEIERHDWPVTALGVPLLVRPARAERVAPLSSEIALVTALLEVLPLYFGRLEGDASEHPVSGPDGTEAVVRPAPGNFEATEEEMVENVLHELDELEAKEQWPVACALALTFQEEHKLLDERLLMRTTSYLHHLGSADSLEEFTEAIAFEAPAAWPYVSAWSGLAKGMPVFRERLAGAVQAHPEAGRALLEGLDPSEDPFLRSWAAIWHNEPRAMDELRAQLKG